MANKILCLCGSGRYSKLHEAIMLKESLEGWIVVGFATSDRQVYLSLPEEKRSELARLHLEKIRICEEVLFLNENGYVGETGKHQLAFALAKHKNIRFYDEQLGNGYLEAFASEIALLVKHYLSDFN